MSDAAPDDHPMEIEPAGTRLRVLFGGETIADTARALIMRETVYPPIYYIPRDDVRMDMLEPSEHTTRCPFKGIASYFSIRGGAGNAENAVWSYETPLGAVSPIRDHLAFYPRYVEFVEGDET